MAHDYTADEAAAVRHMPAGRITTREERYADALREAQSGEATLDLLVACCEAIEPTLLAEWQREALLVRIGELTAKIAEFRSILN